VRVHVPAWEGQGQRQVEAQVRQLRGVTRAQANPLTRNILISFDPAIIDAATIIAEVRQLQPGFAALEHEPPPAPPPAVREQINGTVRARIAVRGMDRDPALAGRVVTSLRNRFGVHARASQLTGRVLVEFSEHEVDVDDLVAEIAEMELPELPDEDRPAHPLDPAPLAQSAARTLGVALGIGLLGLQRLLDRDLVNPTAAAYVSGVIGIARGTPPMRYGLRKLFGHDASEVLLALPSIATLALSDSPLGLALIGAESVRLLTEVVARRKAWRAYEERMADAASAEPGAIVRLESGEKIPLDAKVIEGTGTASARNGLPVPVAPDAVVPAGARLFGGPFVLELQAGKPFVAQARSAPLAPSLYDYYLRASGPLSLAYAALTAIVTRSFARTFAALLLVNPRTAMIGQEAADMGASTYILRAGVTIAGTRKRPIRRPTALLLDGPRLVTDGFQLTHVVPLQEGFDPSELLARAAEIATVAGSPWGSAFGVAGGKHITGGSFDGQTAGAYIGGVRYTLGPVQDEWTIPAATRQHHQGEQFLQLTSERSPDPLGLFALQPRLARGVAELVHACQRHKVKIALLPSHDAAAAQNVGRRTAIPVLVRDDLLRAVQVGQAAGASVAVVSDSPHAAAAFEACDLAIGLSDARSHFPARADVLAPHLDAVTAIIEAGVRREAAVRDAVLLSVVANGIGTVWGLRGAPGVQRASSAVFVTALAAIADGVLRLSGGRQRTADSAALVDPRPERWGRRSIDSTLHTLRTTEMGLTSASAAQRQRAVTTLGHRRTLAAALVDQLRSPLNLILAGGAGVSLFLGAPIDVAIVAATIGANALVGAWQEYRAQLVVETLAHLGAGTGRVLRDGSPATIPATRVVLGDVLLLGPGDYVSADARLLAAQALEVDEAALTGESLPIAKAPDGPTDGSRIVLAGSSVTAGNGRAVVVAVGSQTRMGAITAAVSVDEARQSPLDMRLSSLLRLLLPLAAAGGALVTASSFLRTRSVVPSVAIGASIALAAMPEGMPLLTKVSEAGVARRLAGQHVLTRRLPAVEALGRVDIACTDKTGTLTQGRLALRLVAGRDTEATLPGDLPPHLRHILLTAALASPHPDAQDTAAHPTDLAVTHGAREAGLQLALRAERYAESPFDPMRSFHATLVAGRLCVKGAPEVVLDRCRWVRAGGGPTGELNDATRAQEAARAQQLAARGLRVLAVAEGAEDASPNDPADLVLLGFVGISDPLKPSVREAVQRCRAAGVRVVMLTGDHPMTARTIAREAGVLDGGEILTGAELAVLDSAELDRRIKQVAVIARATPLDKLRIVESLQRLGHTVAMTGDGVNDAPALRLADLGVAMGRGGTEVARQTADIVLTDDNVSTLVEALVEGRSFWRNMRRAISLLLGGNLGELGLVMGASALGFASPLTFRQILVVNMLTDILPGLALALQPPEHRNLAGLAREGAAALDVPLRNEIARRGALTSVPALAAYLVMLRFAPLPEARTVAFASVVGTQLAQTLDMGWVEGRISPSVLGAVGGSAGVLAAAMTLPPLRDLLGVVVPRPLGWMLVAGGALVALAGSRAFSTLALPATTQPDEPGVPGRE
jgi:calcium-translocating P-type ATPase